MRVRIDHFLSFEGHATHLWVGFSAFRRSVSLRSPALVGTSVGEITSHATPNFANWSGRPHNTPATVPPGPASSPAHGSTRTIGYRAQAPALSHLVRQPRLRSSSRHGHPNLKI